jgi:hypothetical protein
LARYPLSAAFICAPAFASCLASISHPPLFFLPSDQVAKLLLPSSFAPCCPSPCSEALGYAASLHSSFLLFAL